MTCRGYRTSGCSSRRRRSMRAERQVHEVLLRAQPGEDPRVRSRPAGPRLGAPVSRTGLGLPELPRSHGARASSPPDPHHLEPAEDAEVAPVGALATSPARCAGPTSKRPGIVSAAHAPAGPWSRSAATTADASATSGDGPMVTIVRRRAPRGSRRRRPSRLLGDHPHARGSCGGTGGPRPTAGPHAGSSCEPASVTGAARRFGGPQARELLRRTRPHPARGAHPAHRRNPAPDQPDPGAPGQLPQRPRSRRGRTRWPAGPPKPACGGHRRGLLEASRSSSDARSSSPCDRRVRVSHAGRPSPISRATGAPRERSTRHHPVDQRPCHHSRKGTYS